MRQNSSKSFMNFLVFLTKSAHNIWYTVHEALRGETLKRGE